MEDYICNRQEKVTRAQNREMKGACVEGHSVKYLGGVPEDVENWNRDVDGGKGTPKKLNLSPPQYN